MTRGSVLVLANDDDARMFRLAGVEAVVCRTEGEVTRAIDGLHAGARSPVALLLVSEPVYRMGRAACDGLDASSEWPIVFVLPAPREGRAP